MASRYARVRSASAREVKLSRAEGLDQRWVTDLSRVWGGKDERTIRPQKEQCVHPSIRKPNPFAANDR